jgi:hypothetical protein
MVKSESVSCQTRDRKSKEQEKTTNDLFLFVYAHHTSQGCAAGEKKCEPQKVSTVQTRRATESQNENKKNVNKTQAGAEWAVTNQKS